MQKEILEIQSLLLESSDMGVTGCMECIGWLRKINDWGTGLEDENTMLREEVERLNRALKGNYDCEG